MAKQIGRREDLAARAVRADARMLDPVAAVRITGIADRSEHRGRLERSGDRHDRRVITLALTEAGHEVLRDAETLLSEQMRSLLAGCDDGRAETFADLLQELTRTVGEFQPGEDMAPPETEVQA